MKLSIHCTAPHCRPSVLSLLILKSPLSHCSAPWSQLSSVKTHTAAAETYYGGLCMPPVARTQEESLMTAAATISTTPGYGQYTSAETNYGSPSHNHQYPLHFGEPISRASKTSKEQRLKNTNFQDCPRSRRQGAPRFRGMVPDRPTLMRRNDTRRRHPLPELRVPLIQRP